MSELNYNKRNQFQRGGKILADNRIDDDMSVNSMSPEKYDKTHRVLFTQEIGRVLPVTYVPVNAGDDFRGSISNYGLFNPMIAPIMDNLVTKMHAFFVPNRIINPNWELFYTKGVKGTYERNLPMIDWSVAKKESPSNFQKLYTAIAQMAWAISHNMTCQQVHDWIVSDPNLNVVRGQRVIDACFGKGSMLDMFNLGFFNISASDAAGQHFPDLTATAPLLAYQFIWNNFYRVENYFTDMFYQPEQSPWTSFNQLTPLGGVNFPQITLPFGWMIQHLYDGALPHTTGTSGSYILTDTDFFFTPHYSDVKISTSGVVTEAKPSIVMIAWLLSMRAVPAEKDYLTTILPQTQRGATESVTSLDGAKNYVYMNAPQSTNMAVKDASGQYRGFALNSGSSMVSNVDFPNVTEASFLYTQGGGVATADQIREVMARARYLERNMVAGYTMPEQLLAKLGIDVGFYDMLKPRYLGGLKCVPDVNKVTQTTPNELGYVGDYAGEASQFANGSWECRCDDYGYIIILCSTAPENIYASFVDRTHYQTKDVTTYPDPAFARLSEQHLYAGEFSGTATKKFYELVNGISAPEDADVVGYIPRYNHYRTKLSTVHGEFIPGIGTLDYFTTARDFSASGDGLSLTPQDIMYHSVEDPQCNRFMQVKQDEFPSINMECRFGLSVLSRLNRIELPVTL